MESEGKLSLIGTPVSELEIDITLVHNLLSDQHPDLSHLTIHYVDSGWDNVMFRLGNKFSVRLFASFLRSLHLPSPANAPLNAVRGVPLNQRKTSVEERMQRLESKTDLITQKLRNTWNTALNMPVEVEAK